MKRRGDIDNEEVMGKVIFSLSKLESRGLISESTDNLAPTIWWGDRDHSENRWKLRHFEILPAGRHFVESVDAQQVAAADA